MDYKILVPSGIGDFSWTWSKLVTTPHRFHIEYMGGYPDRLAAFLALLPADRILSIKPNMDYCTRWNERGELVCFPRNPGVPPVRKAERLSDLSETELVFLESNTFLEAGNRLEGWLSNEMPETDFHYQIKGALKLSRTADYFVVNFSSYGTKKAWGYYEVPDAAHIVKFISVYTGWIPLFVGGEYDDFTRDVHQYLMEGGSPGISLIGKTPDLLEVIAILQQSQMYFGACSGLMVLSNVFKVPVVTYYPPFTKPPGRHLSGTWHSPATKHIGLFWEGVGKDLQILEDFLNWKK